MLCRRCGVELTEDNWRLCYQKKRDYLCNKCQVQRNKEWRERNRDKLREYYKRNRERIRKRNAEWRKRNREKVREYVKRYYWKHRDKLLEKLKEWRQQNKEKILAYERKYMIHYNGYAVRGEKRDYPSNGRCELCGQERRLFYHHWDNNNLMLGLWLCPHCHILAEQTEKGISSEKYLELKRKVEAEELKGKWT